MTTETIKAYLVDTKCPILICLSDGRKFIVAHQDFLIFHPVGDGIFLFQSTGYYIVLNKNHITSLEKSYV
ncbi:MAG TPA: hypothetical protein VF849_01370 [Blattabacteriaceae bacterium]